MRWWGPHDAERLRRDLLEEEDTESFAIELDGELIGVLLVSEENTPDYRYAALDISLTTAHHGRGLGREALRTMIDHLVDERGHHRFTIDPSVDNAVAIRCYSAVGFSPATSPAARRAASRRRDSIIFFIVARTCGAPRS